MPIDALKMNLFQSVYYGIVDGQNMKNFVSFMICRLMLLDVKVRMDSV